MKTAFFILIAFHGIIHFMGFVKALWPGAISQLRGEISRRVGFTWLLTAVLLLLVAITYMVRLNWWWMPGIPALLLSQGLIIRHWSDTKYGTLANIILLMGIVTGFGAWQLNDSVNREIQALYPTIQSETGEVIRQEQTENLPPIVQKWMRHSGVIDREMIRTACMVQEGEMRLARDSEWYPFEARQWSVTEEPGFIWKAKMHATAGIDVAARDLYSNGQGNMLVKIFSLVPVVDASGPEIDQGSMLRYLAELVWYPSAALQYYVSWETSDSLSALATMKYRGKEVKARFFFNHAGDPIRVEANRYYYREEGSTMEKWVCTINAGSYVDIEGIRVPLQASITWKFREGDFHWIQVNIKDIRFNPQQCPAG